MQLNCLARELVPGDCDSYTSRKLSGLNYRFIILIYHSPVRCPLSPNKSHNTAMRTATPLVTCSRMAD